MVSRCYLVFFVCFMYLFISFWGLTYWFSAKCQFLFFRVFDSFQIWFWNGVQTEEKPRNGFFPNGRSPGGFLAKPSGLQGAHKPPLCHQGEAAVGRLVASLAAPRPRSLAYKFPNIPQKIRGASKILFRRRKLPFPRDLISSPFPAPCRRGLWSWRASSSSSSPLQWLMSSSLQTYGSVVSS